jgi:hypothetical protein
VACGYKLSLLLFDLLRDLDGRLQLLFQWSKPGRRNARGSLAAVRIEVERGWSVFGHNQRCCSGVMGSVLALGDPWYIPLFSYF